MKVVVTGGAGFIGSHLVDNLSAEGIMDVWVIDNLYRGSYDNLSQHLHSDSVTFIKGDIRDREHLKRAFKNAEVVFHLAAQSNVLGSIQDPDYSFSTNVVGTYNVLREAGEAGVRRVIFTSSREVYGEPSSLPVKESALLSAKNPYGASKIAAEAYCQAFSRDGLEVVVLRLANVYGPRDSDRVIPLFIKSILQRKTITIYGETKILDFIWIGDVVRVLIDAALREEYFHQAINVGSGVGTNLLNLTEKLQTLLKLKANVHVAPARALEVNGFVADVRRMKEMFRMDNGGDGLENLGVVVQDWNENYSKYVFDKTPQGPGI